jgi:hypothetical protein
MEHGARVKQACEGEADGQRIGRGRRRIGLEAKKRSEGWLAQKAADSGQGAMTHCGGVQPAAATLEPASGLVRGS